MPDRIGFEFPVDPAEQWDGFNNPGIEYYTGSPYHGLGRETTQNSLDAMAGQPAKVEFRLIEVPTQEVPGIAELKEVITRCLEAAKESNKARTFFESAVDIVNAPKIKVLQIADHNTTGLKGPCQNGSPYFALLKASGQSVKDDTSIGSYGIGKFAPFAVSGLRTVFISTVWRDKQEWKHYVQGKAVLMSHYDRHHRIRQGTGFWGHTEKCLPVEDLEDVPIWLRRAHDRDTLEEAIGTTLSILGFQPEKSWRSKIAAVTAENFFGAIERSALEVAIHGGHSIDRITLRKVFYDQGVEQSISELKGEPESFTSSRLFLDVISDGTPGVVIEHCENANLGKMRVQATGARGLA